jgi:CubicO group peptidase (beta-lactamase class C family)
MRSAFRAVLLTAVFVAAVPVRAQELPAGDPARLGFAADRLARIGEVFREHVEAGRIAGAEGMILRRGQVAYHEVWGYRDVEAGVPLERNDIFRICSMTKPVTSVAVMMLWEEGRFALTDPVARYIPAFAEARVARLGSGSTTTNLQTEPPRRAITIQDLLRHTSGLTYGLFANTVVDSLYRAANPMGAPTLESMAGTVAALPLREHPGSRWIYSMSTDVLGHLVEVVSGMPFDAFLRARIFEPLGMKDTDFTIREGDRNRASRSYRHAGAEAALTRNGADACATPFPGGGAGLASTSRDYARFAQMLLDGGALNGTRLLAPGTIELMTADHLGDITGSLHNWITAWQRSSTARRSSFFGQPLAGPSGDHFSVP